MRIGLLYSHAAADGSIQPMLEQIIAAEGLGYDAVWITDDHFSDTGVGSAPIVLAAIAHATRMMRIGTFRTLALDYPVRTAEDFALLDLLSGGRLNFGASVGASAAPFEAYGIPFTERAARFREALDIILAGWAFDEFSYGGEFYRFPSHTAAGTGLKRRRQRSEAYAPQWERGPEQPDFLTITPKPLQQPRPPVWILGDSPEGITFAAGRGHSVVLPAAPPNELAAAAERYDQALAAAHRDRSEVELALMVDVRLDGMRTAADTLERLITLQGATGANEFIWRVPFPEVPAGNLLGALSQFASEVQPMLQS